MPAGIVLGGVGAIHVAEPMPIHQDDVLVVAPVAHLVEGHLHPWAGPILLGQKLSAYRGASGSHHCLAGQSLDKFWLHMQNPKVAAV